MANNGNGVKMILFIFSVIIFPTLFFMGNAVIANDRCRQTEDNKIKEEMTRDRKELSKQLTEDRKEINAKLEIISSQLASLNTEIKYLRPNRTN